MARMRKKGDLPTKVCTACGRPFAWRRKWARDWENVRFCSDRCRRAGRGCSSGANRPISGGKPER
ncbi:DUF2256 domain-containing protein [Rhodovulum adriaticum]|uniref:DUF2256 domain-containing protein n=1 Tax=Rhodovulum adriaticum TaxID=35804 RepID=UPI001051A31A|nr:DUF2256 domain-containing protein [Rhodovulum adriaticum]MBK1636274.1 DUF2256 domain-containing protein [Rhodovulum adriaticum]